MQKSKTKYVDVRINQSVNKLKTLVNQKKRLETTINAQKKNINSLILEKLNTSSIFTKDRIIDCLREKGKQASVKEICEYFRNLGGTDIDTINISNIYVMLHEMEKDGLVRKTKNNHKVTWELLEYACSKKDLDDYFKNKNDNWV